jgi:anti-sigma factor RsiW
MKADCPSKEFLSAFVDGALEASAAAALEVHLDACEECRATARGFRELHRGMRDLAWARAGVDFAPALRAALNKPGTAALRRRERIWRIVPMTLAAAASVMIGVFLGGLLIHTQVTPPVSPAMVAFDVVPPGGICMSARPCSPRGRI